MADIQRVHNTTAYSLVVARTGRRVLAGSSADIDVSDPRAAKAIREGKLIVVPGHAPAPAPEPTSTETTTSTTTTEEGSPDAASPSPTA